MPRATVVNGVGCAREVVHTAGRRVFSLLYRVVDKVAEENFAAGAGVVPDVFLESVDVVKSAPNFLVHLHQADGTYHRANRLEPAVLANELAPTGLLPRRSENDIAVEAVKLRFQLFAGASPLCGLVQKLEHQREISFQVL